MALTTVNSEGIKDDSIKNVDVKSDAAIAATKLADLPASKITSGTIATARLGSGTASSSTFLRGDSSWQTVSGTTINNNANNRVITGSASANTLEGEAGLTFDAGILHLTGGEGLPVDIKLTADEGDDSNDNFIIEGGQGYFKVADFSNGSSWENNLYITAGGSVQLFYDGGKTLETTANGITVFDDGKNDEARLIIQGGEGEGATLYWYADDGDDNADKWRFTAGAGGTLNLQNYADGSWENNIECNGNGNVELYHDANLRAYTTQYGFKVETGTNDSARVQFKTGNHDYSSIGYVGLNRFGIDTHDGVEVRDASASYATRFKIDENGYITKPNLPSFHCVGTPTISNNPGGGSGYDNVCHSFASVQQVGSHYDNSNGRFTAPVAGMYHFTFGIWSGNADASNGNHNAQIRKNGSTNVCGCNHTRDYNNLNMSCTVYLAANDIITPYFNGTGRSSTPRNFFSGHLLG